MCVNKVMDKDYRCLLVCVNMVMEKDYRSLLVCQDGDGKGLHLVVCVNNLW